MPSVGMIISKLNQEGKVVYSINHDEPLSKAYNLMLEHNFSQLPVIEDKHYHLITMNSLLTMLSDFSLTMDQCRLKVEDAIVKVERHFYTDDIFLVIQSVNKDGAALILDENGSLKNILTVYDTSEYFQQWAEDIMLVREIEVDLKEIINASFKKADGSLDKERRERTISNIEKENNAVILSAERIIKAYLIKRKTPLLELNVNHLAHAFFQHIEATEEAELTLPGDITYGTPAMRLNYKKASELVKRLAIAIRSYLEKQIDDEINIDKRLLAEAISQTSSMRDESKEDKMTLGLYIDLFFKECWPKCSSAMTLEQKPLNHMLQGVRNTRNNLAHFDEVKVRAQDRSQLKKCNEIFQKNKKKFIDSLKVTSED